MKQYLETSVLKFKDLSEQPQSKYVLLIQGSNAVPQISLAVDSVGRDANYISGYRNGLSEPIVILPVRTTEWALFDRVTFNEITREQAIRGMAQQIEDLKNLRAELDPEAAEDEAKARQLEHAHLEHLMGQMGKGAVGEAKVGQYI